MLTVAYFVDALHMNRLILPKPYIYVLYKKVCNKYTINQTNGAWALA